MRNAWKKENYEKVVVADPWKAGFSNQTGSGRKINKNKLLSSKKTRFNLYVDNFKNCSICKKHAK